MKNLMIFSALVCFIFSSAVGQDNTSYYATMSLDDAKKLQKEYPEEIYIIDKKRNEAAVLLTEEGGHLLHERILTHGPGYVYQSTRNEALEALEKSLEKNQRVDVDFVISENETVEKALHVINAKNIEDHIRELEGYGSRFYMYESAKQAAKDLKKKWEAMAAQYNRNDVSVRLFEHELSPMPSVIMTIQGSEIPEDYVIVGGHLDSTSRNGNDMAPGADDNASGIATITEATRALFEVDFKPKRTIEVMAYAGEEKGLIGSKEIASTYKSENRNVIAVGQFDMTNYKGSANDIYFIQDNTDKSLNNFLISLIESYNTVGEHQITYGTSRCNYGCSDHFSWDKEGYRTAFPFEANIITREHNANIHTKNDTFDLIGTADHAAKFAKLCAEFLIETAKNNARTLSVDEIVKNDIDIFVQEDILSYKLSGTNAVKNIQLFDINGRLIFQESNASTTGNISISDFNAGVYVISFQLDNDKQWSKKIVLE